MTNDRRRARSATWLRIPLKAGSIPVDDMLARGTKRPANGEAKRLAASGFPVRVTLFVPYAGLIVFLTLVPFDFVLDLTRIARWLQPPALLWSDLVGNVAFFAPLGLWGVLAGRRTPLVVSVVRVTLIGAILSLAVETLQAFTLTRRPGILDLLANTTGAFLGACIAALAWRIGWVDRVERRVAGFANQPLVLPCFGAMALALTKGLVPFDASLHPEAVRRSLRTMQLNPTTDPGAWFGEAHELVFHAMLAGLVFRWAAGRMQRWTAVAAALGTTLAIALIVETLQLVLKSRTTATRDVLSCFVAGGGGIALAWSLPWPGPLTTHRKLLVLYALFAGMLIVLPFELDPGVAMMKVRLLELISGYWVHFHANLTSSTQFLSTLLLFVPIGYLGVKSMANTGSFVGFAGVPLVSAVGAYALHSVHRAVSGDGDHGVVVLAAALGAFVGTLAARAQMATLGHENRYGMYVR